MTQRLVFGVDPGQTGAVAVLADGRCVGFTDMPTMPRKAGGEQINPHALTAALRGWRMQHPGAYTFAVLELVQAMPKMGANSMFRFGQADGIGRGVIGALGIPVVEVAPNVWKKYLQLTGTEKDAARTLAIQRYPEVAHLLARKKDIGRADALLVATWAELTQQVGAAA